jgi:hypothetical protein
MAQVALFAGGAPAALTNVLWLFDQLLINLGLVPQIALLYQFTQGFFDCHSETCLSWNAEQNEYRSPETIISGRSAFVRACSNGEEI